MPLKRKAGSGAACAPVQKLDGSRFVDCPICSQKVAHYLINSHLDYECAKCTSSTAGDAHKLCLQPQGPETKRSRLAQRLRDTGAEQGLADRNHDLKEAKAKSSTPQKGQAWWDQHRRPLAFIPSRHKGHKHALSDEELRQATPCELVRSALPRALAEELLLLLLAESPSWHRGQWVLFGKTHDAPRTSCYYALDAIGEDGGAQEGAVTDGFRDVSARVERRQALHSLRRAADIINATVQELQGRLHAELSPRDQQSPWQCSYALANMYRDGSEATGAHADRITPLGKLPVIASLSIGATRVFRVKRASTASEDAAADTPSGRAHEEAAEVDDAGGVALPMCPDAGQINSVDLHLEHNTLVIMWPPCQEEWRHEVPRSKSVRTHPLSGLARINLTFRRLDAQSAARAPACKCGQKAVLKAALGKRRPPQHLQQRLRPGEHAYYWCCDNTQSGACRFWKWDDGSGMAEVE